MVWFKESIYAKRVRPLLYDAYGLIHTLNGVELKEEIALTYRIIAMLKAGCRMMRILGVNDFRFTCVNDLYETANKRLNILIKLSNA